MRKEIVVIEEPSLHMHMQYDHLTVGELGNILIRLQAALRSIAGLSPGEYDRRYYGQQLRFVISTVHTKQSIDIWVLLGRASLIMGVSGAVSAGIRQARHFFRSFKTALLAADQGQLTGSKDDVEDDGARKAHGHEVTDGLRIEVTRGTIDLKAARPFLDKLTPKQRETLANFLWSITGPTNRVDIGDAESEISIGWPGKVSNE